MRPESFIELIANHNFATVDEEWMRMIEASDVSPRRLAEYDTVLAALCRADQASQAEELAWAAIEATSSNLSPSEAIAAAGPFLLAIGESEELRDQVVELYRTVHSGCEGLDKLLEESGLAGGRPVRRALRTLDVCMALKEGDYLVARDEDGAARIDKLDFSSWDFTITTADGEQTLDAVCLADRYRPATPAEFSVMRQFSPDDLATQMWDDPLPIIIDVCKRNGNRTDSDTLERLLVPQLLSEADWKKWWTKARGAIRGSANLKIEGRSPYELSYTDKPISFEQDMLAAFERLRDPRKRLELVENYLRDCKARNEDPDKEAILQCHNHFAVRATELTRKGAPQAGLWWMLAYRVAQIGGIESGADDAIEFFRNATDVKAIFTQIEHDALLELACDCLIRARPDEWKDHLTAILPVLPAVVCDKAATRLIDAGVTRDDLELVVQEILASPTAHFEALLWLWDAPSKAESIPTPPPVTLLSRILRALSECRRSEKVSKEKARQLGARARQVLSARKYKRFDECLEQLDPGMAQALHTQVRQLDLLGVSVHERLLRRLRAKFPTQDATKETPSWLREDVLYVTEAGMRRKREEIEHHLNVKMKENARAIGRAAAHGDLSENSEYKFALEERDLLRARLAQMNAEMAMAEVVTHTDVPADHVGVGTTVTLRRVSDGEPYEMTISGPWEADSSKGWFNYQTPLAQKVLGKHVGEVVEFEHTAATGTYEITALENALAPHQ